MYMLINGSTFSENFYTLKILTVREVGEENQDDRQGKMLLHTEHSLLSLLSGQHGVIQHHGLFQVRRKLTII